MGRHRGLPQDISQFFIPAPAGACSPFQPWILKYQNLPTGLKVFSGRVRARTQGRTKKQARFTWIIGHQSYRASKDA
jgi:hypothetical protein